MSQRLFVGRCTIDLPFLLTAGDTSEGMLFLLVAGVLAIVAGIGIVIASPILRRMPGGLAVTYVADEEKLTITHADGASSSVQWRVFTGEARRRKGRHGAVLEFPLRRFERTSKRGRSQREVVRMVGVENADEVLAVIGPRIA